MLSSMVTLSLYFIELMHCFSYIFIETSIQYPDITDKHEYSPASVSKHLNWCNVIGQCCIVYSVAANEFNLVSKLAKDISLRHSTLHQDLLIVCVTEIKCIDGLCNFNFMLKR
jgi:hypothetical protein